MPLAAPPLHLPRMHVPLQPATPGPLKLVPLFLLRLLLGLPVGSSGLLLYLQLGSPVHLVLRLLLSPPLRLLLVLRLLMCQLPPPPLPLLGLVLDLASPGQASLLLPLLLLL